MYYARVFFFKQKTAYEVLRSLVGSEMCIRDRPVTPWPGVSLTPDAAGVPGAAAVIAAASGWVLCLSLIHI